MEEIAKLRRKSNMGIGLGVVGLSALVFYTSCVIQTIFVDDLEYGRGAKQQILHAKFDYLHVMLKNFIYGVMLYFEN
jgi:hypothetical protein